MALSYAIYTSDGISGDFAVPFEYFSINHVEVRTNNIIVGFTPLTPNLIRITPTPAAGVVVTIRRRTPPDLTVSPRDFPKFIQYVTEENNDIIYNFDSLYGEIYFDVTAGVTSGDSTSPTFMAVNTALNLSPSPTGSTVTLTGVAEGDVVFEVTYQEPSGLEQRLALATVPDGQSTAAVVPLITTPLNSATIYRFKEVSGTYDVASILIRFLRN